MNVEEMAEELNVYCNYSLSITCYTNRWNISSYKEGSLFRNNNLYVKGTFKEAVTKAYEAMERQKMNKRRN